MPPYYETVRSPHVFLQKARDMSNFDALYQVQNWKSGASDWGIAELYASRVICNAPTRLLALFAGHFPDDPRASHPHISSLIDGPESINALANLWEPQLVQRYQPDSLGYVWAALAPFVRAEKASDDTGNHSGSTAAPTTPERPRRQRTQTVHANTVSSASIETGSASRPSTETSAASSARSMGYTETLSAPLLEDATVRLASCFIRCVLNYAQPHSQQKPFIHFRDERLTHKYTTRYGKVEAIDDGGLQLYDARTRLNNQVALLEAKRTFQVIEDARPCVTDELLAQMVGEALAVRRSLEIKRVSSTNIVTILAATHCIKFFSFKFTDHFLGNYETLPTSSGDENSFLCVDSTEWLSIKFPDHRAAIVSNLLALIAWADAA